MSAAVMEEQKTLTAQEKWAVADANIRSIMLISISMSTSYASTSWRNLPYLIKANFARKTWTA